MKNATDEKLFWNSSKIVENFADRPPDPRILKKLKTFTTKSKLKALDLGCGGGRHTETLLKLGFNTYACDVNKSMLIHTKKRASVYLNPKQLSSGIIWGKAAKLPFKDRFFDLIICTGVLHQAKSLKEYEKEISEVARVLKKGGLILLNIFTNSVLDPDYKFLPQEEYTVITKEGLFMTLLSKEKFYETMKKYGLNLEHFYSEDIKHEFTGSRAVLRANFIKESLKILSPS